MMDDQKLYQEHRNKNKVTDAEKKKMISIKELKNETTEYKRQLNREIKKSPTLRTLYNYGLYISLRLFVELPFRNDFPTLHVDEKTDNYILWKNKSKAEFIIQNYKNSKQLGPRKVVISKSLTKALKEYLKFRNGMVSHDYLLSNLAGKPLSKPGFSKAIHTLTKKLSGKSFGSRILRIVHATENSEIIEKSQELTNKMLHTSNQTKQYIKH